MGNGTPYDYCTGYDQWSLAGGSGRAGSGAFWQEVAANSTCICLAVSWCDSDAHGLPWRWFPHTGQPDTCTTQPDPAAETESDAVSYSNTDKTYTDADEGCNTDGYGYTGTNTDGRGNALAYKTYDEQ